MTKFYLFLFIFLNLAQSGFSQFAKERDEWMRPQWITPAQAQKHHISRLSVVAKNFEGGIGEYYDLVSYMDYDSRGRLIRERNYDVYEGDTAYSSLRTWVWNDAGLPDSAESNVLSSFENSVWVKYAFRYDAGGRLACRLAWENIAGSFVPGDSTLFQYDSKGRLLLQETYASRNGETRLMESTQYLRDKKGRLIHRIENAAETDPDTMHFRWLDNDRLAEQWDFSEVGSLDYDYPPIESDPDTIPVGETTKIILQTLFDYRQNKVIANTRSHGLEPVDLRYQFYRKEIFFNKKGLPERQSSKFKDQSREWIYFYYETH